MKSFPAAEVQRDFGRFQDLVQQEPVTVTSEGQEPCVLISMQEYRRLSRQKREAILAADLTDEEVAELERTLRELPE